MQCIDLLIYGGNIISMDKNNNIYNWLAIRDGLIVDIGKDKEYEKYINLSSESYCLNGKTIVPGFYDCHVHLVQTGLNYQGVDLKNVKSIEELLEIICQTSKITPKGELIRAFHFDVTKTKERRFPTRHELDIASPNNPVWINSIELHTSALNSLALNKINIPYNIDGIARDERNLPLGYFTGKASAFIRNKMLNYINDDMKLKGVQKAIQNAASKGITSINTMEGGFTFHEKDVNFIIDNKETIPVDLKLYFQTFDLEKIKKYNLNCIGGDIFIDGSFGSRTAAISSHYKDLENSNGKLYFSQNELNYFVSKAHEDELQIALHAIGDRAIGQVLNAYEKAQNIYYRSDHRHRIEHFELANREQIKKAKDLELIISVQPAFEYYWGNEGGMYEKRLGKEIADKTNNFRHMIDSGLILCGGSDSDVTDMNPILGIHSAVNHPKKEHSIEVLEALKLFTINAAYASFEDNVKGSIELNKYGDFIVLDKNPLSIPKEEIYSIRILATFKEGNIIYKNKQFRLWGEVIG